MTLPLIHALSKTSYAEKKKVINIVKNHNTDDNKVKEVISFVKEGGGIEYAEGQMKTYQQKAFDILDTFPDNIYRKSLHDLVQFTIERSH